MSEYIAAREAAAQDGLRQLELAALPTGKEWAYWWRERSQLVDMTYAWERALIDGITRLVKNQLTLARMMRLTGEARRVIKYDSEGHVYGEETRSPAEITREALVWFLTQIKPAQREAPVWAEILFRGMEGCYLQQARLGLEADGIKRKGYLTLNHSALAPAPDAFHERGSEVV